MTPWDELEKPELEEVTTEELTANELEEVTTEELTANELEDVTTEELTARELEEVVTDDDAAVLEGGIEDELEPGASSLEDDDRDCSELESCALEEEGDSCPVGDESPHAVSNKVPASTRIRVMDNLIVVAPVDGVKV